jgi:glycosyltransferase involved in cell wall biosynthesis
MKGYVLVVGNYSADHQQSMQRVARLLVRTYQQYGRNVQLVLPPVLFSRFPFLPSVARKYFAYIDKLLLFPVWLILHSRSYDLVHIADHSNAFYAFCVPRCRCIVNCHDLLAMRGAMGDSTVACDASAFGLWLQKLIMAGLRRCGAVVFISHATFRDFQLLIGEPRGQRHAVIPLPLNAPFTPDPDPLGLSSSEKALLPSAPFILMVGSALPRKNRMMALQVLERLGATSYQLVFAGEALSPSERIFRDTHPLGDRLLSMVLPSDALLNVLYSRAHTLLFPSLSEGFGWPLIEAQACGCPVIASTTTSIPEVAGEGALYADPQDADAFAAHVLALEEPALRIEMTRRGFANSLRFTPEEFAEANCRFVFQS